MKFSHAATLLLAAAFAPTTYGSVVVSQAVMEKLYEAAAVSMLTYPDRLYSPLDEDGNLKSYARQPSDYEQFERYIEEPEEAVFAKKDGKCYIAFRGTDMDNTEDALTNLGLTYHDVSTKDGSVTCEARGGIMYGYANSMYDTLALTSSSGRTIEEELEECAATCSNPNDCVVITGHSQGGAIAAIAAIHFAHLNPITVTFGPPNSVRAGCEAIDSERFYRVINAVAMKSSPTQTSDPVDNFFYSTEGGVYNQYDEAPFFKSTWADEYGHLLITSGGSTGFAYLGVDTPIDSGNFYGDPEGDDAPNWYAHNKDLYVIRMKEVLDENHFPVRVNGFPDGTPCTNSIECQGGCNDGVCSSETSSGDLLGSCEECQADYQCTSGRCLDTHGSKYCAGDNQLMDNDCWCEDAGQCNSGRCDMVSSWNPTETICFAKLAAGAWCNENTDCISGNCSWMYCSGERRGLRHSDE